MNGFKKQVRGIMDPPIRVIHPLQIEKLDKIAARLFTLPYRSMNIWKGEIPDLFLYLAFTWLGIDAKSIGNYLGIKERFVYAGATKVKKRVENSQVLSRQIVLIKDYICSDPGLMKVNLKPLTN